MGPRGVAMEHHREWSVLLAELDSNTWLVLGLKISYGTMQPLKATISNNEYDPHYEYLDTANAKK